MSGVSSTRAAAVQALGRLIASESGRRALGRAGYEARTPIIAANEAESVASVMSRVRATGVAPVLLAVHFPARTPGVEFVGLRPAREAGGDHLEARGSSTVGLLVDALARAASGATFSVSSEIVAERFDLASAR